MKDILLKETCPHCRRNLTLMESVRVEVPGEKDESDGSLWLVKRCLECGRYPVTEVAMLVQEKDLPKMVFPKQWKEFRRTGLFGWINMILHTFGWVLVVEVDDNSNITAAYPARTKFRGFDTASQGEIYIKVSEYMVENAGNLLKEAQE